MEDSKKRKVYADYLQLNKILNAQSLTSEAKGEAIHEELFFIIIHQVYELWFKQIISDLDSIFPLFENNCDMELIVIRMQRINKILKLIIQQFEILETMSPMEFLSFRSNLNHMSGFQSFQFRVLEAKFGLKRDERISYSKCPFDADFNSEQKDAFHSVEEQHSLFNCVNSWLEKCPFLKTKNYDFKKSYHAAILQMKESASCKGASYGECPDGEFEKIFNEKEYAETEKKHLSHPAFLTALFIKLYRHHPYLHLPDLLLTEILESDALFTLWRFRHRLMVQKMIGWKKGTGGSSGVHYLQDTVDKYSIFPDLSVIPMVLIPTKYLPDLPENLLPPINFFFSEKKYDQN